MVRLRKAISRVGASAQFAPQIPQIVLVHVITDFLIREPTKPNLFVSYKLLRELI